MVVSWDCWTGFPIKFMSWPGKHLVSRSSSCSCFSRRAFSPLRWAYFRHLAELGIALIVGGLFAFASYANQVTVEISNLKANVAVSPDLTGFAPNKHDLSGFIFSGKKMEAANLRRTNLVEAEFKYVNLEEAELEDADLRAANLFYAVLRQANLARADFRKADLQGAQIATTYIYGGKFAGAKVHDNTCWRIPLAVERTAEPTKQGQTVLDAVINGKLVPRDGMTLGRICSESVVGAKSGEAEKAPPDKQPIYICVDEPNLSRESCG